MNNNDRRTIAIVLAGAVIIGSMVPNYFNIAAFFSHSVPAWIWWMAWLSALVYDAAWLYGSWAHITGGGGRATRIMLIGGVVCAVGINVRQAWLVASATGVGWTIDALAGHALLPVAGLLAVHGLAHYLKTIPADAKEAETVPVAPKAAPNSALIDMLNQWQIEDAAFPPTVTAPKPAPKARKATGGEWRPDALALLREGYTGAEVARRVGVDPAQVSRLKARMGGQAVANG